MAADDTGFLAVQTGKFQETQRIFYQEGLSSGRIIDIHRCSVADWSVIGDGDNEKELNGLSFDKDDKLYVRIIEMPQGVVKSPEDPETMGGVHGNHACLWLPPALTMPLAATADNSPLRCKSRPDEIFGEDKGW